MVHAYGGTSVAHNGQARMMFKYSLAGTVVEAYKEDFNFTTNEYTHTGTSEYVKMQFLDYSTISSVKVVYSNGNAKTWYFGATASDTSDETNLKYGAITKAADDPDGFLAKYTRAEEFDFHGMICSAVDGDIKMYYNNDANSYSATGQIEFQPGSYLRIPVDNGAVVTVTHTSSYNNGGYYYDTYRIWVNNSFIPLFPREFRNSLRTPKTNVNLGMYSKTIVSFNDELYPFSPLEMGYSTTLNYHVQQGYGALPIYSTNASRIKKKAAKDGEPAANATAQIVWLRTANVGGNIGFWYVNTNGAIGNGYATGANANAVLLGCVT